MTRTPEARFEAWLDAYGRAWEGRDPHAFGAIFAPEACYFWTPFEAPKKGHDGIRAAFTAAVARQRDIHFGHELLAVTGAIGIARWHCRFQRVPAGHEVRLDGVLTARLDAAGLGGEFREWWHSSEDRG